MDALEFASRSNSRAARRSPSPLPSVLRAVVPVRRSLPHCVLPGVVGRGRGQGLHVGGT